MSCHSERNEEFVNIKWIFFVMLRMSDTLMGKFHFDTHIHSFILSTPTKPHLQYKDSQIDKALFLYHASRHKS